MIEPPKLTVDPFIVTALLVSELLPILLNVLLLPLIVLLVSICEAVNVAIVSPLILPLVAEMFVNAPDAGVVAPIGVLSKLSKVSATPDIVPPVIATALAFCIAIVPKPDISLVGIAATDVIGEEPLPFTYPDNVPATPVPPLVVLSVPLSVTIPPVGVLGNKPVVPALNEATPPDAEKTLHAPAEYPSN